MVGVVERRTFPVLLMLWVTFSCAFDNLESKSGTDPPVACLIAGKVRSRRPDRRHARSPATQCARDIPIGKPPRKNIPPAFAIRSIAAIEIRTIQRVDVRAATSLRGILPTIHSLPRQGALVQPKLSARHERKRRLTSRRPRNGAARYVGGESAQGLERDILMRRPRIRGIPLQPRLDERRG